MNSLWKNIERFFCNICWITAISFTSFCLYEFGLDKDLCTITFKKFHDSDEYIFPVLSLCFKAPFVGNNISSSNDNVNETSLQRYLEGLEDIPNHLHLRHENFAMDVNKYVLGYWIRWRNGSDFESYQSKDTKHFFITSYLGFLFSENWFYHCSAMQIPHNKDIQIFAVFMNSTVHREEKALGSFPFFTTLHYPKQILRSYSSIKQDWPKRAKNASYSLRYKIESIEVLRRRNKFRYPCYENWRNYDDVILTKHIDKTRCKAPYLNLNSSIRICKTRNEMKKSRLGLRTDDYDFLPPCQSLEKIAYRIEDETFDDRNSMWKIDGTFWIGLFLPQTFKEIEETRFVYQVFLNHHIAYRSNTISKNNHDPTSIFTEQLIYKL